MKTVHFIYADGCEKCMAMREILLSLQYDLNKETKYFDIVEMECDTDAAVDYAVDNGIDEIPAVKIDNLVIQGEDFDERKLRHKLEQTIADFIR